MCYIWVGLAIAQQELTQQRYPELREAQLDQFLTPEEYQLTQQGNLTDTEWGDIFIRLNMAACKRRNVTQQEEFFRDVSHSIDSGFAEVCERLGVMETTISDLLQTLEERLEGLRQEVTEFRQEVRQGLEWLHNQPRGRSFSKQEYRARQNILTQMRSTKLFLKP
ncbi:hypothetical protein [Limnospira fusiformis]|uniref:hypothetical protein n=1 Tax=Limnospira fusiformis TaxID=54297 RepID=UPI00296ECE76